MVVLNFMLSFRKHVWILTCHLSDHLAAQQQRRITIEGDGNCLFCAMAYAIYKTHVKMRKMLARFLLKNKLEFQPFLFTPVEDHVEEMQHKRIWSTALELLAVASLMQLPVYTYTPIHQGVYKWVFYNPLIESSLKFPKEPYDYPTQADDKNDIELLHTRGCHYDCIGTEYLVGCLRVTGLVFVCCRPAMHLYVTHALYFEIYTTLLEVIQLMSIAGYETYVCVCFSVAEKGLMQWYG